MGRCGPGATTPTASSGMAPPRPAPWPSRCRKLADATVIAAGTSHSLALKSDGLISTWGGNDYGQLGDGTAGYRVIEQD
ncbi:hypothetical protein ACN28I_19925 [Archangium gephyra]|uniref:hypothetical protein n=1 Tax=Archangium gephyra TaxID=48 RepID=UPI003B773FAA